MGANLISDKLRNQQQYNQQYRKIGHLARSLLWSDYLLLLFSVLLASVSSFVCSCLPSFRQPEHKKNTKKQFFAF